MKRRNTWFDILNYAIMAFLLLITLYPFWYMFVVTLSTTEGYYMDQFHLIPRTFTMDNYLAVLHNPQIYTGFFNSVLVTVVGVVLNIVLCCMGAYPLSKPYLKGRDVLMRLIVFTMYFNGGMVPFYILVSKLGLKDSLLSLILPTAVNTFNLILIKNFFMSSETVSLEEAAKIDGCNDFKIFWRIIMPVSKPIVATIALFVAVSLWNDWYTPMLFISDSNKYTLAYVLKNMITHGDNSFVQSLQTSVPEVFKATAIMVSTIPIILVYPFVQKYFVKGIMLGGVKG